MLRGLTNLGVATMGARLSPLILRHFKSRKQVADFVARIERVAVGQSGMLSIKMDSLTDNNDVYVLYRLLESKNFHLLLKGGNGVKGFSFGGVECVEELDFSQTAVTGRALMFFKEFRGLKRLSLAGTAIDFASLREVGNIKQIEELNLGNTEADNRVIDYLAHCADLLKLNLFGCRQITDKGVAQLAEYNLIHLQELNLIGTSITGATLDRLWVMVYLQRLLIDQRFADHRGLKVLRETVPELQVVTL
jgi:hypothetical protein